MERKHIKNYRKVLARIRKWRKSELKEARDTLKSSEAALADKEHWDGDVYAWPGKTDPDGRQYYIYRDDLKHRVSWAEKHPKYVEETYGEYLKRLDRADNADKVVEIQVHSWTSKSYVWHAEVWVGVDGAEGYYSEYAKGSAGGGGYDKESAAVQEAFSKLKKAGAALDRMVIEHGEKAWGEYAIDARPFPHFSLSAKGMGVFENLFPRLGFKNGRSMEKAFPEFVLDKDGRAQWSNSYHVILRKSI